MIKLVLVLAISILFVATHVQAEAPAQAKEQVQPKVKTSKLGGVRSIRNLRSYIQSQYSTSSKQDADADAQDKDDAVSFTNSCQCDCCYQVGDHSECVAPTDTMFDVPTCKECNVAKCASKFPISCNEPSSEVNTTCIVRKGWILRIIPIAFLITSAALLIYGCFIKNYDGYHPTRPRSTAQSTSGIAAVKAQDYQATATTETS